MKFGDVPDVLPTKQPFWDGLGVLDDKAMVEAYRLSQKHQRQGLFLRAVDTILYTTPASNVQCTGWPQKVATKFCPNLCQILTDFQTLFTGAFCEKFVVKWLANIPRHLNCVATLPRETCSFIPMDPHFGAALQCCPSA